LYGDTGELKPEDNTLSIQEGIHVFLEVKNIQGILREHRES
jgi:hypothetical protein